MSVVTIGDDLIHYEVLGRGRPVLLLHSWLGSWRYWIPTMQQLKMNYKVYAIDLYGYGDSVKDPNKYSLEHQIKLVEDFIDKMGMPKLALVGHGLGAMIAIEYARRHNQRVPRMLIASAPLFDPGDLDVRATAAQQVEAIKPKPPEERRSAPETTVMSANTAMRTALLQARRSHTSSPEPKKSADPESETLVRPPLSSNNNNLLYKRLVEEKKITPEKLLDLCFRSTEPEYKKLQVDIPKTDARAIVSSMAAFDAGQTLDILRRLPMTTVLVHGKNDDVIEAPSDDVLHYLTGESGDAAVFPVLLDGIRHFPMLEHERFFRLLTDFLDTPDPSKLEIKEIWKRRSH